MMKEIEKSEFVTVEWNGMTFKGKPHPLFDNISNDPAIEFNRILIIDSDNDTTERYNKEGKLIEVIQQDENTDGRV